MRNQGITPVPQPARVRITCSFARRFRVFVIFKGDYLISPVRRGIIPNSTNARTSGCCCALLCHCFPPPMARPPVDSSLEDSSFLKPATGRRLGDAANTLPLYALQPGLPPSLALALSMPASQDQMARTPAVTTCAYTCNVTRSHTARGPKPYKPCCFAPERSRDCPSIETSFPYTVDATVLHSPPTPCVSFCCKSQ